jgi:hypothetical protein
MSSFNGSFVNATKYKDKGNFRTTAILLPYIQQKHCFKTAALTSLSLVWFPLYKFVRAPRRFYWLQVIGKCSLGLFYHGVMIIPHFVKIDYMGATHTQRDAV